MKKKSSLLLAVAALLCISIAFACSNTSENKDKTTLTVDTVAKMMTDMNKANYLIRISEDDSLTKQQKLRDYKQSICTRYNTTPAVYDHDLNIYLHDKRLMTEIFNKTQQ
ncbi:MAG: DUF4296 domain-containing protein [Bacteroidales bacterium]|nr:DUF4296 domain-containing protein [Bacteroidales bacterium]